MLLWLRRMQRGRTVERLPLTTAVVTSEDEESTKLWMSGLVVREACSRATDASDGLPEDYSADE